MSKRLSQSLPCLATALRRVALVLLVLLTGMPSAWAACGSRWALTVTTPVAANGVATSAIKVSYSKNTSFAVTVTITGSAKFNNGTQTFTQSVRSSTPINITATDTLAETVTVTQKSSTCTQTRTITFANAAPIVGTNFSPASIAVNGTSTLSIAFKNANAVALTGVAFADTFPAGLKHGSPLATSNSCGGTLSAVAGGTTLSLSGGSIPAGGGCSVSTSVIATTTGSKINSTGTITSANGLSAAAGSATLSVLAASASLSTVVASPTSVQADGVSSATVTVTLKDDAGIAVAGKLITLAKGSGSSTISTVSGTTSAAGVATFTVKNSTVEGPITYTATDSTDSITLTQTAQVIFTSVQSLSTTFSPTTVPANGTSTLTILLFNSGNANLTGQGITDTYPAGLVNAGTPALSNCAPGTASGVVGGNSVGLVNATVPSKGSCSVTVLVRPQSAGTFNNTVTGNAGSASASLTAIPVSAANSTVVASPTSVAADGTSTSTITVTLKDGATSPNPVASKLVQLTAATGSSTITTVSGTTNALGVATFTVKDAVVEGPLTYTARDTTDNLTLTATAQVTFTPIAALTVTKVFSPATIGDGGLAKMTITLVNPNAAAVTGVAFLDSYPATAGFATSALANDSTLVIDNTCGGHHPLTVAGGTRLDLAGGTVPGRGSCSITVVVTAAGANGNIINSTGVVTSLNAAEAASAAGTLANLNIDAARSSVVASPTSVEADGTTTATITVTLVDGTGVGVADLAVTLGAGSGSSIITGPNSSNANLTDNTGQVTFTVKDSTAEIVTYTATDTTDGIAVTQTAAVTFTAPQSSVTSISCSATCTQAVTTSTVSWGVTFNRSVTGVSASAFTLASTGLTGAYIASVTGSGNSWTVTANLGVGTGTLGLNQTGAGAVSPTLVGTFTGQVYTLLSGSTLALYRFDEISWTGTPAQVLDSSGSGNHGQAKNGATTATASPNPAITTNPGTCRYGVMSGPSVTNGYVTTPLPNLSTDFTVASWMYSTSVNTSNQRILVDDASGSSGFGFSLGDVGSGKLRTYNRGVNPVILDSNYTVSNNTWYFVATSVDITNRQRTIYVFSAAGALLSTTSDTFTGIWGSDAGTTNIGNSQSDYFMGYLDEVQIYPRVLNQAALTALARQTHTCPLLTGPDHFGVSHSGSGVTCTASTVTLSAHNVDHSTFTGYAGTVTLTTSTGRGDWSRIAGSGTLNNGTTNDGAATYAFAAGDNGTVMLGLKDTTAETLGINVADGSVTETSGSAIASEDPPLTFATTGFEFQADGLANALGTQIAGKSSGAAPGAQTLKLRAIKTSDSTGACQAALAGPQVVEFAYECVSPGSCSASALAVTGSGAATNVSGNASGSVNNYANVTLAFAADGTAPFSFLWNDAGSARIHARYSLPLADGSASGKFMAGNSNPFVARPFGFDFILTGNPAASSAAGARYLAAGTTFGGTARAVAWSAADDTDYDGVADGMASGDINPANNANLSDNATTPNFSPASSLSLSSTLVAPSGGNHPGLTGSPSASFANGTASLSGLRYDEVGIIEINASQGGDYLGIGATATSNIRGAAGYVGRFYPKRFLVSANTPVLADRCPGGAFTYQDQPFYFGTAPVLTLTAVNASGGTTANYTTTGFYKLSSSLAGRSYSNAATGTHPLTTALGSGATASGTTGGTGISTLSLPIGSTSDAFTYTRAAPEAPFTALLNANFPATALTDSDGACYDHDNNGICDVFGLSGITGARLRYGRLLTQNALGSELVALALPVTAQYFTGSGFVTNAADSCTTVTTAALDFGVGSYSASPAAGVTTVTIGGGSSTASLGSTTLAAGVLRLSLSPPGAGHTGEIDYQIDLTAAAAAWLKGDWDGGGTPNDNPHARASFGLYAGPPRVIFRRDSL